MMLMKMSASPTPSTTRAVNASGSESATANSACADAMSRAPMMTRRLDPYRSISTPTGTCSAA